MTAMSTTSRNLTDHWDTDHWDARHPRTRSAADPATIDASALPWLAAAEDELHTALVAARASVALCEQVLARLTEARQRAMPETPPDGGDYLSRVPLALASTAALDAAPRSVTSRETEVVRSI